MPRALPRYTMSLKNRSHGTTELQPDTQKRRAIRRLRKMLALNPPNTRGEVRAYPPGVRTPTLIYQARLNLDGKIVVEEL